MESKQLQNYMQKSTQTEIMKSSSKTTPEVRGRWKAIMMILERHQLDKGLAPLEERILVARAKSWEDLLTYAGVPTNRYTDIYRDAMLHYKDEAPFSVYDMLAGWRRIREREDYDRRYPKMSDDFLLPAPKTQKCKACGGSKIRIVNHRIQYVMVNGERKVEKCHECREQAA